MLDGVGMVAAIEKAGGKIKGQRALLIGAGGAEGAIALDLREAGVAALAIHDTAEARRDALIDRLAPHYGGRAIEGTNDPTGFTLVVNATPMGMQPDDPLPIMTDRLTSQAFVADVITKPVVTPLLAAAQRLGCGTQTGAGMDETERDLMDRLSSGCTGLIRPIRSGMTWSLPGASSDQATSAASSVIVAFRTRETGQLALALLAVSANFAASISGTRARVVR